jgi:hypothetical protein
MEKKKEKNPGSPTGKLVSGSQAAQGQMASGNNTSPTVANEPSAEKRDTKRTIDVSALNEEELLSMINGYINSMTNFANKTRNVHKELKDTIANTGIVLKRYTKLKTLHLKEKGPRAQVLRQRMYPSMTRSRRTRRR